MKRYKLIAVLLVVALVATILAACAVTEQPQLTVKVNGKEVKANGTVYAVELDSDVTKAVIEATTTVGEIKGSGTFDIKEGVNEFVLTLKANDTETKYTVKVTRKAVEKPVDVTLAEVKVGEATLVLSEGKYATTVDYEVNKIAVTAKATDSAATVEGAGEKSLNVGKNEVTLTVKNGTETQNYTVEITRQEAVLTLAEVKIGETAITADDNGVYNHTVANNVSSVTIAATATKSYATVEGAGEKTLNIGENTFTLTVKVDDNTKQQYTVKVVREAADLTLKEVKIGDEVLTAQDRTYTCNVANEVTQVTISAVANNTAATVDGVGTKENLAVGENMFEVTVSVGEEQAKYTIIVNRAKSSVKTIAKITVDGVDATYDQAAKTYTATVGKFTAKVDIALTSSVSSYQTDEPIGTLAEGENQFVITVTAEDGTTETYSLVLNVVLPMFNVSYVGNIEGAVASEGYTYKYGDKQIINIVLAAPYTQSYQKLAVTYKVGDGEAKSVTLDDNYGFEVSAAEAIGNIAVDVKGIEINTYTITYHRGGETTTEKVEYGKDAQNAAITPNTETKEVLDGYTYMHDEKWVTQDGGMIVASLTNITADADVYYKDEVLVRSEVAYYAPMGGAVTYYTIKQMNSYVAGLENGDVVFKVLIKSVATDGSSEEEGKTSFVIYGTAVWNPANEMGVSVMASELNKWFTVKASASDKKVTVYRPDGTVATEKTFEAYAADTISLAIHADAAVAAINPVLPELCTVTYLDETGGQITTEKVIKGSAATYVYNKPSEDLGDGYTRAYLNIKWVDTDGEAVNLSSVNSSVTVKVSYDTYIIKNVVTSGDTKITSINKFIGVGSDGKITFRVRVNNTGWSGLNIIAKGGYVGVSGGVSASNTWYIVTIDTISGEISIITEDGIAKELDQQGTYTAQATTLGDIAIKLGNGDLDVAVVNVEVVSMEFYDIDKTTLLKTELLAKGNISYVHKFEADSEGYVKTIDTWLPIDGAENKVYAAGGMHTKTYSVTGSTNGDVVNAGSYIMKYISVNNGKMEVFFTMNFNGMSLGVMEHSGWSQPLQTMNCVAGKMYKLVLSFDDAGKGTTATLFDENGNVFDGKENIDISACTTSAFSFVVKTPVKTWEPLVYETDGSCEIAVRW